MPLLAAVLSGKCSRLHLEWMCLLPENICFLKMVQTRPLFCLFSFFSRVKYGTKLTINYKSIDGMFGTWTQGGRMVGANESTELLRHPWSICYSVTIKRRTLREVTMLQSAADANLLHRLALIIKNGSFHFFVVLKLSGKNVIRETFNLALIAISRQD